MVFATERDIYINEFVLARERESQRKCVSVCVCVRVCVCVMSLDEVGLKQASCPTLNAIHFSAAELL